MSKRKSLDVLEEELELANQLVLSNKKDLEQVKNKKARLEKLAYGSKVARKPSRLDLIKMRNDEDDTRKRLGHSLVRVKSIKAQIRSLKTRLSCDKVLAKAKL